MVQDGLVAVQYVLLPLLAQSLGLSYAQIGILRAIGMTAMSLLEIPGGILADRISKRLLLAGGLMVAGGGYVGMAQTSGFHGVALCFFLAGAGAAFQHSIASAMIIQVFSESSRRRALGTYNASGDAGKLAYTGFFSLAISAGLSWQLTTLMLGLSAVLFGLWIVFAITDSPPAPTVTQPEQSSESTDYWGIRHARRFWTLCSITFLDSLVQSVFLTFVAFVMLEKGSSAGVASLAVVLVLIGGMVGKFACGFMASRYGDRMTFQLLQASTVVGLFLVYLLDPVVLLVMLPLVGLVVQATSTVTYGSVAAEVHHDKQSRGYALMYSFSGLSSIAGPFAFGLLADQFGATTAMAWLSLAAIITLPLAAVLTPLHRDQPR